MILPPGSVRVSIFLLCCSLFALLPRPTQAQGGPLAQVAGMIDVYAGLPVVSSLLERSALERAGGGVAARESAVENLAWKAPARAPVALPTPDFTLFAATNETSTLAAAVPSPTVSAPVASAGIVRAQSETTYYDVRGRDRADLAAALRQNGPRIQGSRFFGLTEWQVSVEYRPSDQAEHCAIRDLTVHVEVETHLPRWNPPSDASADLHRAWEQFVAALDEHEHGHRALATEAAEAIREGLAAAHASACDELDPVAQRTMQQVMNTYESHNLAYDARTGHGRTQGAVWPPRP